MRSGPRGPGLEYDTHPQVYVPAEDTFLLLRSIAVRPGQRFLDLGCGAGLVGIRAAKLGARVLATDTNAAALRLARSNAERNSVRIGHARCDMERGLRMGRFDAVAFNPPYLPTAIDERIPGSLNAAFDGGESGRDSVARFLRAIADSGVPCAWFVASSLQDLSRLEAVGEDSGLHLRRVARQDLPFERLFVYSAELLADGRDRGRVWSRPVVKRPERLTERGRRKT